MTHGMSGLFQGISPHDVPVAPALAVADDGEDPRTGPAVAPEGICLAGRVSRLSVRSLVLARLLLVKGVRRPRLTVGSPAKYTLPNLSGRTPGVLVPPPPSFGAEVRDRGRQGQIFPRGGLQGTVPRDQKAGEEGGYGHDFSTIPEWAPLRVDRAAALPPPLPPLRPSLPELRQSLDSATLVSCARGGGRAGWNSVPREFARNSQAFGTRLRERRPRLTYLAREPRRAGPAHAAATHDDHPPGGIERGSKARACS